MLMVGKYNRIVVAVERWRVDLGRKSMGITLNPATKTHVQHKKRGMQVVCNSHMNNVFNARTSTRNVTTRVTMRGMNTCTPQTTPVLAIFFAPLRGAWGCLIILNY